VSRPFPIPEAALAAHIAVLGKTGAGKTATTKLVVEHVAGEEFRVCVLDTQKSDWWGITSSATGKSAGLPFRILGGPRGHVPLHSSAGKAIGQLVGSGKLPLSIIDMADFEAGGVQRFFVEFAQALWKSMRGVVYLVIEEAHELAPKERAGFGAENMSIHWAKKLATGSRTKGIRLIVATQSVQQLHNRVLGSCETLIAHRLIAPADQDPVVKWMRANAQRGQADEVEASLASLPTGTGWVCSGEAKVFEKIGFPKFKTYDNTATPTGDAADVDVKTAAVDPDELRAIIGDAVAQAEANDPERLKAKIADLTAKLSRAEYAAGVASDRAAAASDAAAIAAAEQRGYARALADSEDAIECFLGRVTGRIGNARALAGQLHTSMQEIDAATDDAFKTAFARLRGAAPRLQTQDEARRELQPLPRPDADRRKLSERPPTPNGSNIADKVLRAMAELDALGVPSPTRELVGGMAGYGNITSKGFRQAVAALIDCGALAVPGDGRLALTPSGHAIAPQAMRASSVAEMRDRIVGVLGAPADRILDELIRAYPAVIMRDELGHRTGFTNITSKAFRQAVARLIDMGFALNRDGGVVATEALFP
jgi:hypothetical protein